MPVVEFLNCFKWFKKIKATFKLRGDFKNYVYLKNPLNLSIEDKMTVFKFLNHSLRKSGQLILIRLFLGCILWVCISCPPPPKPHKEPGFKVDTDTPPEKRGPVLDCDTRAREDGPEVSITSQLPFVDSNNASAYELEGRCTHNHRGIQITVNDYPLKESLVCKSRRWKAALYLTKLIQHEEPDSIHIKVSQGKNSNVLCKKVPVIFKCPKNYILVPALEDYSEYDFCVMKYEAKLLSRDDDKVVSQPERIPITHVSYKRAVRLCRNNGSRYSLMTNDHWQTIARHIEDTNENWSSGRDSRMVGNTLNCGVNIGSVREASSNDEDSCAPSSPSCKQGSWHYKKRTHTLPNGQVIWDLCGNAGEMVQDENTIDYDFDDFVYLLQGQAKKRFGPRKSYSDLDKRSYQRREANYWGLGEAELNSSRSLIVRGKQGRYAGIFSVNLDKDQESFTTGFNVGFRCVYSP